MATRIDTRAFDPESGLELWRSGLGTLFDLDVRIEHDHGIGFHNRLEFRRLGTLGVSQVEGQPHCTDVSPRASRAGSDESVVVRLVAQGVGWLVQGGVRAPIRPGTFCFYSGSEPRTTTWTSPFRCTVVDIPRASLIRALAGHAMTIPGSFDALHGPGAVLADFIRSVLERCPENDAPGLPAYAEVAVQLLATALIAAPVSRAEPPASIEDLHRARIRDYVGRHVRDPGLSVDSISRGVGLSARYVHQLCASEPQPLMRSVWSMRLDGANLELQLAPLRRRTVGEIAAGWGFADAAHFSRAFKKRFGVTPAQARTQGRREG